MTLKQDIEKIGGKIKKSMGIIQALQDPKTMYNPDIKALAGATAHEYLPEMPANYFNGEPNDVVYGLAASVWGKNIFACMKVAKELKFGTVWINEHGILVSEMPHGGYKQSGFGKDLSLYSMEEYTQLKHIYIDQTNLARKPWHSTVYGN